MDDIDRITENTLMLDAMAIRSVRALLPSGSGRIRCEDCDAPIPERRRKAVPGCTRCVECQAEIEAIRC